MTLEIPFRFFLEPLHILSREHFCKVRSKRGSQQISAGMLWNLLPGSGLAVRQLRSTTSVEWWWWTFSYNQRGMCNHRIAVNNIHIKKLQKDGNCMVMLVERPALCFVGTPRAEYGMNWAANQLCMTYALEARKSYIADSQLNSCHTCLET